MKIVVVMPTYNEADNIGLMIEALGRVFKSITKHNMHLLVVDGNSPDGTAKRVRAHSDKPWLHLLVEEKKIGMGSAYTVGFELAINELKADAVVEMDADFQHDPQDLPKLITPLESGYDHVIGSRFVKGGSIPKEWSFRRKFLSIGGSIFTKIVLGIWSINDFSSGFKATKVKGFLDSMDFSDIKKRGFSYKVEMLYKIYKAGAKIKQVPIKFALRDRGDSKMESDNFWDTLFLVLSLRSHKNIFYKKEFIKFGVVGGLGFITDAGVFNLLSFAALAPRVSALLSGFLAMILTFTLNNIWSFKERKIKNPAKVAQNVLFYICVSSIPIILRSKLIAAFDNWFGHNFWIYNTAFVIGVAFGLVWNFIIYSKVIWRKAHRP